MSDLRAPPNALPNEVSGENLQALVNELDGSNRGMPNFLVRNSGSRKD